MAKPKLTFCCQTCGTLYPKWTGQCTGCCEWNTIVEEASVEALPPSRYQGFAGIGTTLTRMADVTLEKEFRLSSGLQELDRVLGGGIIMGSAILIGGDPGIGKSTILLQAIAHLSQTCKVLYVTGEESPQQITLRARRLGLPENHLWLLADTHVENIIKHVQKEKPRVLVIDSIQTMLTSLLSSAPGSVGQVRESAMQLVNYAKQTNTALFLVGHVTKEGHLAGPRVLEHMVDTVLYFEGEQDSRHRIIRAVKNRFGAVNEIGIFAMTEKGLREINQPSAIFLSRYEQPVAGSIITASKEGSRPLLVEVQALVDQSHAGNPRRLSVGLDTQRLSMLLAILNRHSGISTHSLDVFLNVVGGLQIFETAADLPILFAILSSLRNRPLPADLIVFGELGLAGEIRPVPGGQERLKEASKHGFKIAMVPQGNLPPKSMDGMKIFPVQALKEAVACIEHLALLPTA
ncbi:MAG: DNA repair protein RadA [Gammaproteobacteria bacterium RIFCSPHIGHO2_12_FULL_45_12]|nr:MAG: DNA repair protein RadA [Gammaproteobacteria bacterium RIFCSPHIGHO2_12_FULL_45_12]